MSPETISPYSDRPIRPLPKRRLRERLSPDIVELIKYPLAPRANPPMFYHSYNLRGETGTNGTIESLNSGERKRFDELEKNYVSRRNDKDLTGEIEEAAYSDWIFSRRSIDTATGSYSFFQKSDTKNYNSQPPGSTASSIDGYDSFENTNNKKKRKIPTPGESNLNGIRISGDVIGSSSQDDLEDLVHQSQSSLQGICGPGRGRYGRNRNGKSPINTFSDGPSNWNGARSSKQRQAQWSSPPESAGIISRSIATANAERNFSTTSRLQEDASLQQYASKKSSPASTQFTFSCDTQIPGWPGLNTSLTVQQNTLPTRMSTHATQTSPKVASKRSTVCPKEVPLGQPYASNGMKQNHDQVTPMKKTRRRTGKDYLTAAKQRRHQQGYRNYHSPVASEDVWICEFCEYERIFGTPPEALIRQYEIKDRRARKQEAERRRLLEKARMKGRKGKKGNKSTTKSTLNHDRQTQIQNQNVQSSSTDKAYLQNQTYSNNSEEYIKDDFDNTADFVQDQPSKSIAPPPNLSDIESTPSDFRLCNDSRINVSNENYVAI
ncbi:hypothetical protein OnM2_051038 [Erysiphe neolycopersici]|uniref:Uncharacterized protein n=1 Tax=Erysiphe neolycopersici TaxID=212602 RepID=A0A420HSJ2_9PEZI|nr:hypothetical protein OnM2_051038 [Erysiphe neolycopersici]